MTVLWAGLIEAIEYGVDTQKNNAIRPGRLNILVRVYVFQKCLLSLIALHNSVSLGTQEKLCLQQGRVL